MKVKGTFKKTFTVRKKNRLVKTAVLGTLERWKMDGQAISL